jgi:hypothetical protein
MNEAPQVPAGVDTGRPTPARIYDYMLQDSNYFQVDRFAAEQILKAAPEIRDAAWSNRGFHQRAAKWIAQHGVRQFVDIGSGLPTVGNTHDVVQKVAPTAHVVYVDNDPMVELHSRALLDSGGTFSVICADLREPESILFFEGLELVQPYEGAEPGVTFTGLWGAEDVPMADSDGSRWLYCGVARKP